MSERMTAYQLKLVGENCSQYQQQKRGISAAVELYEGDGISCTTCRNWTGYRCIIDAFDNVAVNLDILSEEE